MGFPSPSFLKNNRYFFMILFFWLAVFSSEVFALDEQTCDSQLPSLGSSIQVIANLAAQGEKVLSAGAVCTAVYKKYKESGCTIQDIRGFQPEKEKAKNAIGQIPGGFLRVVKSCPNSNLESAVVVYKRKPASSGNVPRTDECMEQEFSPPKFHRHITRTVTKKDPTDYSKQKSYAVIEDFDYDPVNGAKLKMVSYAGDEIQCYGGEFDPREPKEVKYLYCLAQGKKVAPLRKDQFAVIANGRFSVADAMNLPAPIVFQTGTDYKPTEDQMIPTK
jgi:hypothetical protein